MKIFYSLILMVIMLTYDFAHAQQSTISNSDLDKINFIARKIYSIPYRDAICAFSDLRAPDGGYPRYVDKKFDEKKNREQAYFSTFGEIFSESLIKKYKNQCVNAYANSAGMTPDFRTADEDSENDYLLTSAPTLKIISKPQVIQDISGRIRLKVLWKQVGREGPNTQVTDGRTDLIFIRENGDWRLSDAITGSMYGVANDSIQDFEASMGVIYLSK